MTRKATFEEPGNVFSEAGRTVRGDEIREERG